MKKLLATALLLMAGCTKEIQKSQSQSAMKVVSYQMIRAEPDPENATAAPTGKVWDICTTRDQYYKVSFTVHYIKLHPTVVAAYSQTDSLRIYGSLVDPGLQKLTMAWGEKIEENVCFKIITDGTWQNDFKDGRVIDSMWYRCCNRCTFQNK